MKTKTAMDLIEFKDGVDEDDMAEIHVLLFIVLLDMAAWHNSKGYTMTVTELITTLEQDEALHRESDAHRTNRGADLRCRHMSAGHKEEFKTHFNKKYKEIASISRSDLVPRLVVEHGEGANRHFHVALNFKYRIVE